MTTPTTIQATNRSQVSTVRFSISHTQATIARIGITGTHGTLNARGRSGRVRRSTSTPAETRTKANNVPTLTISSSLSAGKKVAAIATSAPTTSVARVGV